MRILIVTHSSNLEGAERSVLEVIESLISRKNEVAVIVRESGDFTSVLKERGVEYHQLNYGWWTVEKDEFSSNWLKKTDLISSEIARLIDEFGANLVYTNTSVVPFGALASIKAGVPHVWHIRELASGKIFDRFRNVLPQIGSIVSLTSNRIIFNSEATRGSWQDFIGDSVKTEIIYNSIPSRELVHREGTGVFRVAVVGSILPIKNQMEALQAFSTDRIKNSDLELEIIGPDRDEEYYHKLRRFANENNLEKRIRFTGYRENPFSERPSLCLVCGNSEGFGRVLVEAIMSGIPVLAAKGGATDELIHNGKTGFLYESGNVEELSEKLLKLSTEDLTEHIKKARELISEKFSRENTIEKLLACLEAASLQDHPLLVLQRFLNPYGNHKDHLEYVGSIDLLKEVVRRKLRLGSNE
jgi:glycosyltransferase involved in cell wall biosynthesis